MSAVDCAGVLL